MEQKAIDTSGMRKRGKDGGRPKGRQVEPRALAEVRALLGDAPRRRDLLIEFLHRIQDAHGHLSAAHIVALAQEMSLAMTEVYEVATFYHHFDVVKEGESPPPALTVRVCETLSCQLAGAEALHAAVASACGPGVRVIGAPCIGRCEHAPAAVVGRNPIDRASADTVMAAVTGKRTEPRRAPRTSTTAYRAAGGYGTLPRVRARRAPARGRDQDRWRIRACAAWAAPGFPVGRKWKIVRAEAGAAAHGGQHRRRRAGHVQGPATTSSAIRTAFSKAC